MAEAISAGALDLLEYAFRASTTLEAGLGQIARYGRVVSDRAAAELTEQGDVVTVLFGAATQRQRIDFALAFLVKLAREATGTPLAVRWVRWRRQYACSRLVKLGSRP